MTISDVFFRSDGLRIAAYLGAPDDWEAGSPARPAILMLPGYAGNPHFDCIHMMRRLCAAGWFVLSFAYRGYGQSEGERGRNRPFEQVQNCYDALTYLQTVPGIDPGRIGVFGTSFGGAHGLWIAAHDQRVRCLVTSVAVTNGERWMRIIRRPWEWQAFEDRVMDAARGRVVTGESTLVPLDEILIRDPDTLKEIEKRRGTTLPKVDLDLESAEALIRYRPDWVANRISPRPVLMIYGELDHLVPPEETLACYAACGEPKRLVKLPRASHYDSYEFRNPQTSAIVHREAVAWFRQYL
jgi:dipeptidyl aminopeptidase/acylaminoacyl peptidase